MRATLTFAPAAGAPRHSLVFTAGFGGTLDTETASLSAHSGAVDAGLRMQLLGTEPQIDREVNVAARDLYRS